MSAQATSGEAPLAFAQELHHANVVAVPERQRSVFFTAQLDGELDTAALTAAISELVGRHDALRLRVSATEDGLRQVLLPVPADRDLVRCVELVNATAEQFERYARRTLRDLLGRPWQAPDGRPADDLPCRFVLLRHSPQRHALLASFSSLVVDERSRRLLIPRLWELYAAFRNGAARSAQPGPTPFLDAIRLQRTRFARRACTTNVRYWQGQHTELAGLPPAATTTVPAVSAADDAAVAHREMIIGHQRLDELRQECERRGLNLAHRLFGQFVSAVFSIVDSHWLVVDFPIDLRSGPDADTIGMFVLGVPVVVRRQANIDDQIQNIRKALMGAMVHCHVAPDAMAGFRELVATRCAEERVPRLAASHSYFELEGGRELETAGLVVRMSMYNPALRRVSRGIDLRANEFPSSMDLQLVADTAVVPGPAAASLMKRFVDGLGVSTGG